MSPLSIVKSTGERERFDPAKLVESLRKSGATQDQAEKVLRHIEGELVEGMTTNEIYRHAFEILRKVAHPAAVARYSMKRAITELGPTGFPFEKFIAEIFKSEGYEALTDQIVQGSCVEHEIDVVAWKGDELVMVEAKFHNEYGIKSDLKVALYIKARWDDLKENVYAYGGKKRKVTSFQLFTNTKFTDAAIRYAECKGLTLIGWNYPRRGNLEDLVSEAGLHPVTAMTTLGQAEKKSLLDGGIVLCKQVAAQGQNLLSYGISKSKVASVLEEAQHICG
ncbi:MAG: restriction endonuclease [Patescibacteria group bacterium]|nr:restriction endonuclease [Patescibacteria group bacterium]MDE2116333.1 restriction endonuclease [Patescibacteria group bacterium]